MNFHPPLPPPRLVPSSPASLSFVPARPHHWSLQQQRRRGPVSGAEDGEGEGTEDGQQRAGAPACPRHQRGVQGAGQDGSAAPEERQTSDQVTDPAPGGGCHPQSGTTSQRSVSYKDTLIAVTTTHLDLDTLDCQDSDTN